MEPLYSSCCGLDVHSRTVQACVRRLGKASRCMLRALIAGDKDSSEMAELARRQLRAKIPELRLALEGHVTDHHRFLLMELMHHPEYLEA